MLPVVGVDEIVEGDESSGLVDDDPTTKVLVTVVALFDDELEGAVEDDCAGLLEDIVVADPKCELEETPLERLETTVDDIVVT